MTVLKIVVLLTISSVAISPSLTSTITRTVSTSKAPLEIVTTSFVTTTATTLHITTTTKNKQKPSATFATRGRRSPFLNNRSCLTKYGNPGWLCDDNQTCIWLPYVCDGIPPPDCPDGSDEAAGCSEDPRYCPFEAGAIGWKCDDGECIDKSRVCDSFQHCRDGSDERAGCDDLDLVPCPGNPGTWTERWAAHVDCRRCWDDASNWRCDNGHCVQKNFVCDGDPGCRDGSDEWAGCELATCSNDSSVTTVSMYKDGDCRRCWDEHKWRCNDGECIDKAFLCDTRKDCRDGEDETIGCGSLVLCVVDGVTVKTETKYLQSGKCRSCYHKDYWRCNSGQCIHSRRVCDNVMFSRWDCKDGSDEEPGSGCPKVTCLADTSIVTTHLFYNKTKLDCLSCPGDKKGEINKSYRRCHNGQCKQKILFCNGYGDCSDNSDEVGCGIFTYFQTYHAVLLSCALVAVTTLIYIILGKCVIFLNLRSIPTTFPKKTPLLYKHIRKYCDMLDLHADDDSNLDPFKTLHSSIRNRRNGLRELITTVTSLYREPQLCHVNCKKLLSIEASFHENANDKDTEALQYIRLVAGSSEYTDKFINALDTPGLVSKLSFLNARASESVSVKARYFVRVCKPLLKMVLFYLDVIKDVVLCMKLLTIIGELDDVNVLHQILVYISCVLIFFSQAIIGLYLVATMGKPMVCMAYKKIPPPIFGVTLLLLFSISPVYPIILVVKDSILNCDIQEAKYELKSKKNKELTKFLTLVSQGNKEGMKTKQQFGFYKMTDSALESLPQLIIYAIFCLTYYYGNSLIHIFLNNTSTSNIILFASSIPLSLYSVVSGINVYSSPNGKQHYSKTISLMLQVISRVTAILSFISPMYALYSTTFKASFEDSILSVEPYSDYSWVGYFLTTSLVSVTYPHIVSLFLMLGAIFTFHGIFIFVDSSKHVPGFSCSPFFQKVTHTLANLLIVLPWRLFGYEEQRRKLKEQQTLHIAMVISNMYIVLVASLCRTYTEENIIFLGHGTKTHLEWIFKYVDIDSPSTLPLLSQLSPYHHHIGLLLNLAAHLPWLILTLGLQALGIFTMGLYYKRFHPWRKINSADVYNAPTVQEIITVNFTDEEAPLSDEEWVDENDMEGDDEDEALQQENGEQLELREIVIPERIVTEEVERRITKGNVVEEANPVQVIQGIIDDIIFYNIGVNEDDEKKNTKGNVTEEVNPVQVIEEIINELLMDI